MTRRRTKPVPMPTPERLLRVAKSEVARLSRALDTIAKSTDTDAEGLRDEANDALFGPGPLDHESEAEELRSGIEKMAADADLIRNMVAADADEKAVLLSDVLDLLDRVDARDSLKFLERKPPRSASTRLRPASRFARAFAMEVRKRYRTRWSAYGENTTMTAADAIAIARNIAIKLGKEQP